MKKILTALTVLLVSVSALQAQQKYVKVKKDFKNNGIQFFTGEIYALDTLNGNKKQFTVNGKECSAINDVDIISDSVGVCDKTAIKDSLVKKIKDKDSIRIDISSVFKPADTVRLANYTEKTQKITDSITVTTLNTDSVFRLIIPNTVTVWYSKSDLTEYVEPPVPVVGDNGETDNEEHSLIQKIASNVPGGIYTLAGLVALLLFLIAGCVWLLFLRKGKEEYEVIFRGQSLTKFAKKYGGIDKLHELNPETIPSQEEWNRMSKNKKKRKSDSLKGESFTVPPKNEKEEKVNTSPQPDSEKDIPAQLRNMQKIILEEINKIKSTDSKAEKEKLEKSIIEKEAEIDRLRSEKEKFETLTKEKEEQIHQLNTANKNLNDKYGALNAKIIRVEYLQTSADALYAYFNLCSEVERKAGAYYDKTAAADESKVTACLLQKFRSNICDIPLGEWVQIIKDIKETGVTANRQVIRIVSQPSTDSEKQREFRKTLFREVTVRYSSAVLILAESFRNLDRFGINKVDEAAPEFKKYVDSIVNTAKTVNMELKYVPLFEKFDVYAAKIESENKNRSFPYSAIHNLESDSIAEIVSYGVKTEFEDTKTKIIIK
jgi:hypothetical protein